MRTHTHYTDLMQRNPNTSVGLSLATQAVYAAVHGSFDANSDDHDREYYRNTYQRLQRKYGETLGADDVLNEMQLVNAASALSKSKAGKPKAAQASRDNGAKGGRPAGDTTLTTLQQQILALRQSGLKIKEIADRLGRNPENIRQTLARAMRKSGMTGGWTETARKG